MLDEARIQQTISFVRDLYQSKEFIPLHEPRFMGNDKRYVLDAIDSTFVSSVGAYVDRFEREIENLTGTERAVATVNGTSAIHIALLLAGVQAGDEVITQSLTFVATCNAIHYCNANPVFVDVDRNTMGLSSDSLRLYLEKNAELKNGVCFNKSTGNRIAACLPMHTFGFPCRIDEISTVCVEYGITLVEDAAESMGSYYKGKHTGSFGKLGAFSLNGNKTITSGGGGVIVTNNELGARGKHLTTTAKIPHKWEYKHDEIGFNYRMPNLNAALACAQLEQLRSFVENKRQTAAKYATFFESIGIEFAQEPKEAKANYWLMAVILKDRDERDQFLNATNSENVMTRPIWNLMHKLDFYANCQHGDLSNSEFLVDRVVNIPSSVIA